MGGSTFGVIWGLTCLGAVNATPGSIEGFIYTEVSLKDHLVGMRSYYPGTGILRIILVVGAQGKVETIDRDKNIVAHGETL